MNHQEGLAHFAATGAFYRPRSHRTRDLGVLAAAVLRQERGSLRLLDAMAGCGVRSLRYALEAQADFLWVNEGNPDLAPLLQNNLRPLGDRHHLTHRDAHRLFFHCYDQQDYYDFLDVDGFGTGSPHLETCLWAATLGGLIYLTATDGRTGTGHNPQRSLQHYGAYARYHPAGQEQVLRLLLGTVQQRAAGRGRGVQPLFSYFCGQTYRVMVRLVAKPQLTEDNFGMAGYCPPCGHRQSQPWRRLSTTCTACGHPYVSLSGPLWLGPLHDRPFLEAMIAQTSDRPWIQSTPLLHQLIAETPLPPYYYPLAEIGRRGGCDLPKRDRLIQALGDRGEKAVVPHCDPQAIKTTAPLETCIQLARQLSAPGSVR